MVCVNIDIGNAFDIVFVSEVFNSNTAIVEHAKTSRNMTARMM